MNLPYDLTREDWGARPPNRSYVSIPPSSRPGVETHHSVGLYNASSPHAFARSLQRDHLSRNWTDAFYNVAIFTDGSIIELRPATAQSGPIPSLTICFAGNYDNLTLTDQQMSAWRRVRNAARAAGVGDGVTWHGQRAQVACPGRNVIDWLRAGHPHPTPTPPPKDPTMPTPEEIAKAVINELKAELASESRDIVHGSRHGGVFTRWVRNAVWLHVIGRNGPNMAQTMHALSRYLRDK